MNRIIFETMYFPPIPEKKVETVLKRILGA